MHDSAYKKLVTKNENSRDSRRSVTAKNQGLLAVFPHKFPQKFGTQIFGSKSS